MGGICLRLEGGAGSISAKGGRLEIAAQLLGAAAEPRNRPTSSTPFI
ncbi:MAG: hypothetical protein QW587_06625 [Candidatus Bathyarchaeia archaeon]